MLVVTQMVKSPTDTVGGKIQGILNNRSLFGRNQELPANHHDGGSVKNSPVVGMTKSSRRQESFGIKKIREQVDKKDEEFIKVPGRDISPP